ncbi:hypothetical protein ES705_46636 [subsurface metagenome]
MDEGKDISFTIKPNTNYDIEKVLVDGNSVGAVNTYTFNDVAKDHAIRATFSEVEPEPEPEKELTGIEVFPEVITLSLEGTKSLTVIAYYSDNSHNDVTSNCSYESSDPEIVSVSDDGIVKGKDYGRENITASYKEEINKSTYIEETDTVEVTVGQVHNITQDKYYGTIQVAIDDAKLGETIEVSEGTYIGNLEIDVEGLTLKSTVKHGAVIQTGAGFLSGPYGGITVLANNVTIDGFRIEQDVDKAIIHTQSSQGTTIKNNRIISVDDVRSRGIDVGWASANSDGVLIEGNEFYGLYCGVYVNRGQDLTIEYNDFEDMDMADGAIVFEFQQTDRVQVKNNEVKDAGNLLYFFIVVGSVTAEDNTLINTKLSNYGVYNTDQNIFFSFIQDAVNEAETYDTIEVAAGTYDEIVTVNVEGITIRGESTDTVFVDGFIIDADNTTIEGITII